MSSPSIFICSITPVLQRDASVYELSLAQVRITKTNVITVVDERYDKVYCGAIRPKNLTEFNTMIVGFQNQFKAWFDNMQGEAIRGIYIQIGDPTSPTLGDIWIQT